MTFASCFMLGSWSFSFTSLIVAYQVEDQVILITKANASDIVLRKRNVVTGAAGDMDI